MMNKKQLAHHSSFRIHHFRKFGDGGEVVVVVLGDEEGHVYDAHLFAEARVDGTGGDLFVAQGFEAADEPSARDAERGEQVFEHRVVVAGLVGLAVAEVGGAQSFEAARAPAGAGWSGRGVSAALPLSSARPPPPPPRRRSTTHGKTPNGRLKSNS